jgi:hypothetical protein
VLKNSYTTESLEKQGVAVLEGHDRQWFNLLNEANKKLETTEKMCFHIARADYTIEYSFEGNCTLDEDWANESEAWERLGTKKSVSNWHDLNGELHKWRHIRMNFFTDLVVASSEREPFFEYNKKGTWGQYTDEIDKYSRSKNRRYHK